MPSPCFRRGRRALRSYLHSGTAVDFRISAFTKYSTLHFRRDPSLSDVVFNGISQNALLKSFANGMQVDAVGKIAPDHNCVVVCW